MITKDQFWHIAGVHQHIQFESYLRRIALDKPKREQFLSKLIDIDPNCVEVDTFKRYFEDYAAERKSNQQDYTPDSISYLLARLSNQTKPDTFKIGKIPLYMPVEWLVPFEQQGKDEQLSLF